MIKAVKVLNAGSTFLFVAILLLIYAYLPISVDLNVSRVSNIHKQHFFYYTVSAFLGMNVLLRIILRFGFPTIGQELLGWMTALIFILNVYLTFLVGFIGVWNNATHIGPSNYSYLNLLGPLLLLIWVGGLIFLVVKNK